MWSKYRKGIFIITYYLDKKGKKKYLILHRKHHWTGWEFPKGGIESFEWKKKTLKREIKEETGLDILKFKKFGEKGKYKYTKDFSDRKGFVGQTYRLYSAEVGKGEVKIDKREHDGFKWVSFNMAVKKLTWPNQIKCLRIVEKTF